MKIFFVLTLNFLALTVVGQQQTNAINWKQYMAKQDLVFDTLTDKWEEGAFLGNGLIGAMIYREDKNAIRFDLGRTDVVDHRDGVNPSIGRARMPIGKFVLRTLGNIQKIQLRLDLWNAELYGTIYTDKGAIHLQALIPATTDVMLFNTSASTTNKLFTWEWKPEKSMSPFLTLGRDDPKKYPPNPDYIKSTEKNINYSYQALLAGGSYTTAWKAMTVSKQESLVVTIQNTYPENESKKLAEQTINSITSRNFTSFITAHRNYWHSFYQKSFISIPDSRLESFWWIQQYKMASATRVGAFPIDLMGPWYKPSPWPKYWWNLNIQLTYYPFYSSNHVDLTRPLMKMVNDNIDNLSKNAPEPYQHNSAALARSGPFTMTSGIRVLKGNDSTSASAASLELGNLTWLLHVYWQAYEHTYDNKIMRDIYPVLKRAINYYLNIMDKGSDGKYHLPYTYSPEYPRGITRDANYDLSVLRWGAKTLLYINSELKLNDTLAQKWQDVLDHLTPYPADEKGYRIGRDADFSISHRHYSHLLQVYPLYDVNWDQAGKRDIILKSLNQWKSQDQAWRGYSYTGSGSIYAMMGDGDSTWKLLNEMIDKGRFAIKPNTMYLEAGPVIETPLSAVTTLNEMLLQSWGGIVRVFPAIPARWKDASFDKLLAKGAFEVSAVRKNGVTLFIRIRSLAGQPCLVKTGWSSDVKATGKRSFKVTQQDNAVVAVDLKKGEEVILYTGTKPSSFLMSEGSDDGKYYHWGLPLEPLKGSK